ncbi:hypothetical protein Acr_01g0008030 [Actinidia rufa]|uniref:Uncharacterized protein n=1 Tax=Actinidia rufa TaxID=165716 RepID=A0A7J0E3B8_9ERIC|nr:hypothetical protein Acr_01g0008030 [Actinidia rufa]
MFTKTNLGGEEESEQSLPSWISDHLGAKSYIDETSQSPSSPPPNSPKMDTLSLTKEGNVMTQAELDKLGSTYSFPSGIRLRIPGDGETILSARQGEGGVLRSRFSGRLKASHSPDYQGNFGSLQDLPCAVIPQRVAIRHMFAGDLAPLQTSYVLIAEQRERVEDKVLLRLGGMSGSSLRARPPAILCEFPDLGERQSCNKLPTLSEVDAKRTEEVLGKIDPGGYFEVSKVLGSRTFQKHFATSCTALSTSGGDNTASGEEGEFITREDSVEYLGVIRQAMSARAGAPTFGEKTGGKAKAEKATTAKPPTKGIVIREKRTREGVPVIEIGEPDSSKGKEAAPPPAPKRFKSNRGAINARRPAAWAGTSSPGGDVGSESMSDASVARRLLTGVIPASDKEEVDRLSENDLVAKSFHALGQRNKLAELSEDGSKPGNEVDDLKATVAELTNKLAKAKELAIEDFKASGEFKAAVTDSAATYFSEGFEFCKRQLLHQFPNLGIDVANMAMDPSFAEEEEAIKEGEDPVPGVAPNV